MITRYRKPASRILLLLCVCAGPAVGGDSEQSFLRANRVAMGRMMAAMNIRPTGQVDSDFAAMMIPHHLGAIEMAKAELQFGTNEQLRRIAQGIVIEQQQEITAMQFALGPSSLAPTMSADPRAMTGRSDQNTGAHASP